jgi:hypothetical protein
MALIDIYNNRITIYGVMDSTFVTELQSEYSGFTIEYKTTDYDGEF